jgi:hypothetical protein
MIFKALFKFVRRGLGFGQSWCQAHVVIVLQLLGHFVGSHKQQVASGW